VTKNEQKIFVLCDENNSQAESLSKQLEIPLITRNEINSLKEGFFLAWREDRQEKMINDWVLKYGEIVTNILVWLWRLRIL